MCVSVMMRRCFAKYEKNLPQVLDLKENFKANKMIKTSKSKQRSLYCVISIT